MSGICVFLPAYSEWLATTIITVRIIWTNKKLHTPCFVLLAAHACMNCLMAATIYPVSRLQLPRLRTALFQELNISYYENNTEGTEYICLHDGNFGVHNTDPHHAASYAVVMCHQDPRNPVTAGIVSTAAAPSPHSNGTSGSRIPDTERISSNSFKTTSGNGGGAVVDPSSTTIPVRAQACVSLFTVGFVVIVYWDLEAVFKGCMQSYRNLIS